MPPSDWMNRELSELGERWTVSESPKVQGASPSTRSYIAYDGSPRFAGSASTGEGGDYKPGDPVAFNVHYKLIGPNQVEVTNIAQETAIEPDFTPETQRIMVQAFTKEIEKERKAATVTSATSTMTPGDNLFISAFAFGGDGNPRPSFTQDDLDELKIGQKVAFVMTEISYKDLRKTHHARRCMFLQPPATPSGIWHACEVFNDSD